MKHHSRYYTNPAGVHRPNLTCGYSAVGKMADSQSSFINIQNPVPGIKLFSGRYSAVPIVVHEDGKEIIILEIKSGSRYFYYKCCSPEDCLDLQKVLLGKADITAHTKMSIVNTNERLARQIPTPKEAVTNSDSLSTDIVNQFWKWCDDRDRLLNLYNTVPSLFTEWIACENNTSVQILLNQIVPVFLGGAVGKA